MEPPGSLPWPVPGGAHRMRAVPRIPHRSLRAGRLGLAGRKRQQFGHPLSLRRRSRRGHDFASRVRRRRVESNWIWNRPVSAVLRAEGRYRSNQTVSRVRVLQRLGFDSRILGTQLRTGGGDMVSAMTPPLETGPECGATAAVFLYVCGPTMIVRSIVAFDPKQSEYNLALV